jgi:hypothetical protein
MLGSMSMELADANSGRSGVLGSGAAWSAAGTAIKRNQLYRNAVSSVNVAF